MPSFQVLKGGASLSNFVDIRVTSHNCHGVSNNCLFNSFFMLITKKTSSYCLTFVAEPMMHKEFPCHDVIMGFGNYTNDWPLIFLAYFLNNQNCLIC